MVRIHLEAFVAGFGNDGRARWVSRGRDVPLSFNEAVDNTLTHTAPFHTAAVV